MAVLSSKRMGTANSSCSWASITDVSAGLGRGCVCLMQHREISLLLLIDSMKQICIGTGSDIYE